MNKPRYQLYKATGDPKKPFIMSVGVSKKSDAIRLAEENATRWNGVFVVVDNTGQKRSGGVVDKYKVIYNTLTKGE